MSEDTLSEDEDKLLTLVPKNGSTVSNKKVRDRLGWDETRYFEARNTLVDRGLLGRGAGRGGTVFRLLETEEAEVTVKVPIADTKEAATAAVEAVQREESLYAPIREVLSGHRARDQRSTPLAVEIIARQGRRATGGTWSRPDLVQIEVLNLLYLPTKILEVITFEVKPEDAIDVQCVYEALAHRRAATRAYVMLHVPTNSRPRLQEALNAVANTARSHGIGVIEFADPGDYETWEEVAIAERFEPAPERMNSFLETQLDDKLKTRLARELR